MSDEHHESDDELSTLTKITIGLVVFIFCVLFMIICFLMYERFVLARTASRSALSLWTGSQLSRLIRGHLPEETNSLKSVNLRPQVDNLPVLTKNEEEIVQKLRTLTADPKQGWDALKGSAEAEAGKYAKATVKKYAKAAFDKFRSNK